MYNKEEDDLISDTGIPIFLFVALWIAVERIIQVGFFYSLYITSAIAYVLWIIYKIIKE